MDMEMEIPDLRVLGRDVVPCGGHGGPMGDGSPMECQRWGWECQAGC